MRIGGDIIKRTIKIFTVLMTIVSVTIFSFCGVVSYLTPSEFTINPENKLIFDCELPVSIEYNKKVLAVDTTPQNSQRTTATIKLFNTIPVKEVNINFSERKYVVPCGTPFGIKIYTDGLVVVQTSEIETNNGIVNPSLNAEIQCGDIIKSVNGLNLTTNEQLLDCVEKSDGKPIIVKGERNGKSYSTIINPVLDKNQNAYRIGLWVKDSCAGIGTLTFTDNITKTFGGLGHGICDSESGQIMPLLNGDIVSASISSVRKSSCGSPGSLCGYFLQDKTIGTLSSNSECGVYGNIISSNTDTDEIPVAFRQEVTRGKAQILTTVDGSKPMYYDVEIESISYNNNNSTKNMVIKITDEKLLEKTGGIVQGMSGSPIIQNNMLVGAVTHVFINDPSHGYAIFAENMINFNDSIIQNNVDLVS